MVEQPRGKPREPVAMIHLRAVRDFARVDHGFFLPLVSGTLVSKHPSPKSVTIRKVLEFIEQLPAGPPQPRTALYGLFRGFDTTEEEIAEARREMWSNFPREDI